MEMPLNNKPRETIHVIVLDRVRVLVLVRSPSAKCCVHSLSCSLLIRALSLFDIMF